MTRTFKDSLPWLAPSAAILVGAGLLSFTMGGREPDPEAAVPAARSDMAQAAVAAPAPEPGDPADIAAALEEVVARQSTLAESLDPLPEVALAEPAPTVAAPAPLRPVAAAAPLPDFSPRTAESANAVCRADLEKLSEAVRVYFPSGGLTAEQAGIENARIIALIAQDCPGIRIRVQGHSDPSGDPEANLRLSQQRAEEVLRRIAASGADTASFVAEGLGDRVPSGLTGPMPEGYYDRRVEFVVEAVDRRTASIAPLKVNPFANAACVTELEAAARNTALFYAPRAVSLPSADVDIALALAEKAAACPHARLRVVGHHSGDVQSGETPAVARLRTQALMAMLVARGVPSEQVIIASPSEPWRSVDQSGLPGSRVVFDVILEEG